MGGVIAELLEGDGWVDSVFAEEVVDVYFVAL